MSEVVNVSIEDAKKAVYFIANLTQMQGSRPMRGALNSKGDYMGGILDRWINLIPESVIFNKILLPKVSRNHKIEVITDYYDYDPKLVNIAPDVIGISVDGKTIPFVQFDEKWVPVKDMPQIEIKTFKKNQKMASLRNQNYDNKYLILAETDFRVDYLVPLLKEELFSGDVYSQLSMNDNDFIVSNSKGLITQVPQIDLSRKDLGTISLLKVTTAKSFMDNSIKCEGGVSVEYIKSIVKRKSNISKKVGFLKDYCSKQENGLFRFNENWYDKIDSNNIPYRNGRKVRTLDFQTNNINALELLKINKSSISIKALENCIFENCELKENTIYNVKLACLERNSNIEEYFISKNSLPYLINSENELLDKFKKIIKK